MEQGGQTWRSHGHMKGKGAQPAAPLLDLLPAQRTGHPCRGSGEMERGSPGPRGHTQGSPSKPQVENSHHKPQPPTRWCQARCPVPPSPRSSPAGTQGWPPCSQEPSEEKASGFQQLQNAAEGASPSVPWVPGGASRGAQGGEVSLGTRLLSVWGRLFPGIWATQREEVPSWQHRQVCLQGTKGAGAGSYWGLRERTQGPTQEGTWCWGRGPVCGLRGSQHSWSHEPQSNLSVQDSDPRVGQTGRVPTLPPGPGRPGSTALRLRFCLWKGVGEAGRVEQTATRPLGTLRQEDRNPSPAWAT